MIPVFKEPASNIPKNAMFNRRVSHIRVRSEHTMGALKGRFQCLRGLRITIKSNLDHEYACQWVTCAIILHNLIIDVGQQSEGGDIDYFSKTDTQVEEQENITDDEEGDNGIGGVGDSLTNGEEKRNQLVSELLEYRALRDHSSS